jgi:hypothetical protein
MYRGRRSTSSDGGRSAKREAKKSGEAQKDSKNRQISKTKIIQFLFQNSVRNSGNGGGGWRKGTESGEERKRSADVENFFASHRLRSLIGLGRAE